MMVAGYCLLFVALVLMRIGDLVGFGCDLLCPRMNLVVWLLDCCVSIQGLVCCALLGVFVVCVFVVVVCLRCLWVGCWPFDCALGCFVVFVLVWCYLIMLIWFWMVCVCFAIGCGLFIAVAFWWFLVALLFVVVVPFRLLGGLWCLLRIGALFSCGLTC